jgi:hypothetical protein
MSVHRIIYGTGSGFDLVSPSENTVHTYVWDLEQLSFSSVYTKLGPIHLGRHSA